MSLQQTVRTRTSETCNLIDASKEVDLEINVEKSKYMLLSRHQSVRQNSKIAIGKNSKQIVWNCITVQIFGDDSNK
jgi:hypothetical protein